MTDEEIQLLRMLAFSKAQHGGTIDARLVVLTIDTLRPPLPDPLCECHGADVQSGKHGAYCPSGTR